MLRTILNPKTHSRRFIAFCPLRAFASQRAQRAR
jgi:hypothetical protein